MGVLPMEFKDNATWESLGLDGTEVFDIPDLGDDLQARSEIDVLARKLDGTEVSFTVSVRIDTPVEIEYFRHGGILQKVLRDLV